jgi:uncharacterized protein
MYRQGRWHSQLESNVMTVLLFTILVWTASLLAGFLGALTGLGGGVVLVPVLALVFRVHIRYAIGASLVSVIATSSGAAAAYVKEGYTNIRIGMLLEIGTTLGALAGAFLATVVSTQTIAIVFGVVLIYSAYQSLFVPETGGRESLAPDPLASRLKLNGEFPVGNVRQHYYVQNVPTGFGLMFGAGALSGLLGIGSGAVKVLAMDRAMRIPFKVSTTTSNFMIGVTAVASAGVYLSRGYIDPGLAMPVMLGVLTGALMGTKVLVRTRVPTLRKIFASVIFLLAVEMLFNGLMGRL